MEKILFLVHRIPYPPNKGDKIRSYHFLKALAENYQVYLGAFIDDQEDWQYSDKLTDFCEDLFCQALNPKIAKIKSLQGLLTGKALSLPYYQSQAMQQWVLDTLKQQKIKKILIFSSVMAQFVPENQDIDMIVDFVDVDSDKWRQYSQQKIWPESWVYQREARQLLSYEKAIAKKSKVSFFVSEQEAKLFKQLAPDLEDKISWVNNGVDTGFFNPRESYDNPYAADETALVFTGAMDYWPNIDAVVWFAQQVFPIILQHYPHARFYIVGSKPAKEVLALAEQSENIVVTGRVEDIRPYLNYAAVAVAPLRVARGIQNKVLEAMAMTRTILATPAAMEGISGYQDIDVEIADEAEPLADKARQLLSRPPQQLISNRNREFVTEFFSWDSSGNKLRQLIEH